MASDFEHLGEPMPIPESLPAQPGELSRLREDVSGLVVFLRGIEAFGSIRVILPEDDPDAVQLVGDTRAKSKGLAPYRDDTIAASAHVLRVVINARHLGPDDTITTVRKDTYTAGGGKGLHTRDAWRQERKGGRDYRLFDSFVSRTRLITADDVGGLRVDYFVPLSRASGYNAFPEQ
jgi:hypothetical protein